MCGRYSLALRPSRVRQMLQDDDVPVDDAPDDEGAGAPRQSYNFAPGYHGIVYRADVPDWGAGPARERGAKTPRGKKNSGATANAAEKDQHPADDNNEEEGAVEKETAKQKTTTHHDHTDVHYKLQSMKWGLIPFWTKRNPDYASMLKTINCRDDSLAQSGGMWASMKARKRCVVIGQGFYEWLKPGGPGSKEKVPHFVKRKDGKLMCMAGLWDCVVYEDAGKGDGEGEDGAGEGAEKHKNYTYTIITTDSNPQLRFLHDRMPVILDQGSEALRTWLDPGRHEWSKELQSLLKPYEGELEVYPVSKEVGKVGNDSPSFIIPVASKENKSNIANFFAKGAAKQQATRHESTKAEPRGEAKVEPEVEVKKADGSEEAKSVDDVARQATDDGYSVQSATAGVKRGVSSSDVDDEPPMKKAVTGTSPTKPESPVKSPVKRRVQGRQKISATSNAVKSPAKKGKSDGSQKITKFFAHSS